MNLPSVVQVGPYTFAIVCSKQAILEEDAKDLAFKLASDDESDSSVGRFLDLQQQILLDPDQKEDMMADTLLHEILHAIYYTSALKEIELRDLNEEQLVGILTPILLDTLRRNPEVVNYLMNSRTICSLESSKT